MSMNVVLCSATQTWGCDFSGYTLPLTMPACLASRLLQSVGLHHHLEPARRSAGLLPQAALAADVGPAEAWWAADLPSPGMPTRCLFPAAREICLGTAKVSRRFILPVSLCRQRPLHHVAPCSESACTCAVLHQQCSTKAEATLQR